MSDLFDDLMRRLEDAQPPMAKAADYYAGRQPLAYLDPEVASALSGRLAPVVVGWPRLVCNAVEERLDVDGFRLAAGDPADADLWRIWQSNNLDEASQQAHLEALIGGRCYVIVWAGPDPSTPRITVESAAQVITVRDPATREVTAALKRWHADGYGHATLFLPSEVRRYRTRNQGSTAYGDLPYLPASSTGWEQTGTLPNPLDVVPVVPVVNRPRLLNLDGESELVEVMPLADAVNKLATDMLVSAEYHAAPRRWITGMGDGMGQAAMDRTALVVQQRWENARASKLWIAGEPDTKFGQFPEADLSNFINAIGMFTQQLAALTGLPPHYLGLSTDNPASADAIRSAESSLVAKARRRQKAFGGAWEDVMRLAVQVRDGQPAQGLDALETIWRDPETRTTAQAADAAVKLVAAGIIPPAQAQEDLGYTPVQIERMAADRLTADPGTRQPRLVLDRPDPMVATS